MPPWPSESATQRRTLFALSACIRCCASNARLDLLSQGESSTHGMCRLSWQCASGALKHQYHRAVVQLRDFAHCRYVFYNQFVRLTDVLGPQRVRPEALRTRMAEAGSMGLRNMLLGPPLDEERPPVSAALDSHLLGMLELLPKVYGDDEECKQAVLEVGAVVDMDGAKRECVACKRAALLYGLHHERALRHHWEGQHADGSAAMARDLATRVLPFVVPRFVRHGCQTPEVFVLLTLVLSEMWEGEQLGNWPLDGASAP